MPSRIESAAGPRRTLLAVACVFLANGFIIGAWAVRVVEVQRSHGLGEAGLGAALVCVGAGALLSMPPTGALATRFGSAASTLRATLDQALATPPADCAALAALNQQVGDGCKACHQEFRS